MACKQPNEKGSASENGWSVDDVSPADDFGANRLRDAAAAVFVGPAISKVSGDAGSGRLSRMVHARDTSTAMPGEELASADVARRERRRSTLPGDERGWPIKPGGEPWRRRALVAMRPVPL